MGYASGSFTVAKHEWIPTTHGQKGSNPQAEDDNGKLAFAGEVAKKGQHRQTGERQKISGFQTSGFLVC